MNDCCLFVVFKKNLTALIFTATCIARTMLWQDVCLSVCHMPVLSLNSYHKVFSPLGSPTILVFPYQMG